MTKSYKVAVIPGDGIGKEVMPEGVRVLEAAGQVFDGSATVCPEDGLATIRNHDAVFFGACGFPGGPDHVSLWELLVPMRRGFDLYVNLRPVRLMPGIQSPLAGRKQAPVFAEVNTTGIRCPSRSARSSGSCSSSGVTSPFSR